MHKAWKRARVYAAGLPNIIVSLLCRLYVPNSKHITYAQMFIPFERITTRPNDRRPFCRALGCVAAAVPLLLLTVFSLPLSLSVARSYFLLCSFIIACYSTVRPLSIFGVCLFFYLCFVPSC